VWIYAIHVANSVLHRFDGRKTSEIFSVSKSIKRQKIQNISSKIDHNEITASQAAH
jgi:hypothetical protein